jgi:hypothetical protein
LSVKKPFAALVLENMGGIQLHWQFDYIFFSFSIQLFLFSFFVLYTYTKPSVPNALHIFNNYQYVALGIFVVWCRVEGLETGKKKRRKIFYSFFPTCFHLDNRDE